MNLRDQMENLIEDMLDGQILLTEAINEFEKVYIQKALERKNEHLSQTADILGIHRNTLSKKVSCYQNNGHKPPKKLLAKRAKTK